MQTPLNPYEKQQLWRQYEAQSNIPYQIVKYLRLAGHITKNTRFWLPIFADIVQVKLKPLDNEVYQENLKQTLQELTKKHEKINIESVTNPIVNKALNNKKLRPKIHQASLFDYLK